MLTLGYNHIGKYIIWVTPPTFDFKADDPEVINLNYFLVLVTRTEKVKSENETFNVKYYVNLIKSDHFKFLFNIDKNYRPIDGSCDMVQYNYYLDNKEMSMPLWKLSKQNISALLDKCRELSADNI